MYEHAEDSKKYKKVKIKEKLICLAYKLRTENVRYFITDAGCEKFRYYNSSTVICSLLYFYCLYCPGGLR